MIAVDTSVLLAIFKGEEDGLAWNSLLQAVGRSEGLGVSPVVIAEIRAFFATDDDCRAAMAAVGVARSELTTESALLAGAIFRQYRKLGGPRTTILPDFLVAAHAALQASALATVDRGYIRTYFPRLKLLVPKGDDAGSE